MFVQLSDSTREKGTEGANNPDFESSTARPHAAIRLNREGIKNSPAVHAKITDSLKLAEMIIAKMKN
jgi:hypothetical protein